MKSLLFSSIFLLLILTSQAGPNPENTCCESPQGSTGIQGIKGLQGPPGPIGPTGLDGPAGIDGLKGLPGLIGPIGQTGATGNDGPAGPDGPQGDPGTAGNPGTTGPTAASNLGDFFVLGSQTIPAGGDVQFQSAGAISTPPDLLYSAGKFTIGETGVYDIEFQLSSSTANQPVGICVNSAPGAQSTLFRSFRGQHLLVAATLIQLNAGDVISVCNMSGSNLVLYTSQFDYIGALVQIVRIA